MLLFVVGTFAFGFAFTFAFSGVTPHATVFGAVRKDTTCVVRLQFTICPLRIKDVFPCPFRGLGQGVVINIWPVKPFETVMLIKCYTNTIELN